MSSLSAEYPSSASELAGRDKSRAKVCSVESSRAYALSFSLYLVERKSVFQKCIVTPRVIVSPSRGYITIRTTQLKVERLRAVYKEKKGDSMSSSRLRNEPGNVTLRSFKKQMNPYYLPTRRYRGNDRCVIDRYNV